METAAVVRSIGLHQSWSHNHPDNILPAELLIPAADIRNAASAALTPADWARSGRKVKGVKSARVATPSARATNRKVDHKKQETLLQSSLAKYEWMIHLRVL